MEFKCRICAGSLTINPKTRIAVCDYCGTKQVLPIFGDDSSKVLFERGTQYLQHNEYDKAEAVFTQLLSVNPNDGEIYWDIVQCKYGVTYAKDPQTGKYIPTCNRTLTDSIFKDEHYLKAIELSSADKAALYKNDATIIENIQKGILEISRKEKPFDIFISYKESDENGNRTKDSIVAQGLYEKLTELGYKVFFSRVTLESKIGEEYEPYIYAALSSSKAMITVCSSEENIQSAWVKNEWSRFLTLRRSDASKTLIPVYFDMDPDRLPEEFALLAAQDQSADDFEQELIRGIKKLIPTPIELKEYRKKRNKLVAIVGSIVAVAAIIIGGGIYYKSAKEAKLAEEAAAQAAEIEEKYKTAKNLFNAKDYDAAKPQLEELGDYKDSAELAYKCTYYADYGAAMEYYYDRNYPEAVWALEKVGDYDDVKESLEKCKNAWREDMSTIAINNEPGGVSKGAYYVTSNGTVDAFTSSPGNSNVEVTVGSSGEKVSEVELGVNSHGKVVGISSNEELYALYEDGYVCNSAYLNKMENDWNDIIWISDRFNVTNAALKADGTVLIGSTTSENSDDKWLQSVASWKDIVQMDSDIWFYERGEDAIAALVGVDVNGKVYLAFWENEAGNIYFEYSYDVREYIESLSNIKKIKIDCDNYGIAIMALDKDNVLHFYPSRKKISDGNYTMDECFDVGEIKDFWLAPNGDKLIIDSANKYRVINDDKTILDGAVYVDAGYVVTQSGSIYTYDGEATSGKTKVKDIWLER